MLVDFSQTREDIGRTNRGMVLSEILFHGPISRSHIAERVGLTAASISRITRQLIDAGLVVEDEALEQDRPGRRFIELKVNPTGCFVAGISINAFRQDIAIADLTNAVVATQKLAPTDMSDGVATLEFCAQALRDLIQQTGIDKNRLVGCGITITGAIDPERCLVRSAPLLGWQAIDIRSSVEPYLKLPLFVDSIPNAKNLTARGFGSGKGLRNVVLLNVSLAIGCSMMLDGRLVRGQEFNAGLIDQWLLPGEHSNDLQPINALTGGSAVLNELDSHQHLSGSEAAFKLVTVLSDADKGDYQAIAALNKAGEALALCIANINALLHPEIFLLSGPLIESEIYCGGIRNRSSELLGAEFVTGRLRFANISNREAACALAIFQSLTMGEVSSQIITGRRNAN